ncbi:RNA-guided endonuclease InsQ/TnpB family protein [Planobispora takensis]|uniref:Cas12f1-like TNB domain-containing protein n=1 Tax=Planobispora takensis TaxID=1367882 RepID=A0A8J3WRG7_9ACTN|nr:zinc ribbon domain-containing protein [Planobispora takensis]GIH99528.1 hypothetical protein Pta02_15370 [Planobispora takensis]
MLQQTLKDLDVACRRYGTAKVRWKTKTRWRPSFRFPTPGQISVETINHRWGRVFLPKLGWVRFRLSRPLSASVRSATVSCDGAHRLTRDYAHVVFEDLNVRGMTASASGTATAPGARVAQKSGLNRAILDKGWYGLEIAVRSAARRTGSILDKVPAAYTSQTCSNPACGRVDAKSRDSQALFTCTACGHSEHADVNAAKCIKARGRAAGPVVSGRGDFGAARVGEASSTRSTARGAPRAAV